MSFHLFVSDQRKRSERIKVCVGNSNTTVKEFRAKLRPEDEYGNKDLFHKDERLEENHTLAFYGIKHEDEIIAKPRESRREVREGVILPQTRSMDCLALMEKPEDPDQASVPNSEHETQ